MGSRSCAVYRCLTRKWSCASNLQHWPHEKIEMKMFTLINVLLFAIVCVASVPTDYKCGYLPRELTLKRGERQKLIFWNDRVYDQPPTTTQSEDNNVLETTTKDYFLEPA